MVLSCSVDEETGEIKQNPRKPATVHKAPIRQSKPVGQSDYAAARAIVEGFGKPLAFQAGQFFAFDVRTGWVAATDQIRQRAHSAKKRNGDKTILPIIEAQLAVPDTRFHPEAPIYLERVWRRGEDGSVAGTNLVWDGEWVPFQLGSRQVLFTDALVDVVDDSLEPIDLSGRIIYGPRISLPYYLEGGSAERCEEFEAMVERALPNPEIRRHFQEVMGLVCQPHEILRGQIILWGAAGSGKTTIAAAIACACAGTLGASFIQESELVQNKWVAQGLLNRFANVSDDSPRVRGWPGFVKRYSSGTVAIEPKYAQPTSVPATAKLISTCNEMQDAADASGAMLDRLHPFRFDQRLTDLTATHLMTPRYWSDKTRRTGILTWLLEGLTRLRRRGHLRPPEVWEIEKRMAVAESDPLEAWLVENLVRAPGEFIEREVLLARVPVELMGTGRSAASADRRLVVYLTRLFEAGTERRRGLGSDEKKRVYTGINWA